ncbi:hypothetical protein ALPO108162_14625 [Alicyclobacillus pomorum]
MGIFGRKSKEKSGSRIVSQHEIQLRTGEKLYTGKVRFKNRIPDTEPRLPSSQKNHS